MNLFLIKIKKTETYCKLIKHTLYWFEKNFFSRNYIFISNKFINELIYKEKNEFN